MSSFETFSVSLRKGLTVPNVVLRATESTNLLARHVVSEGGATRSPWPPCWFVAFEQQAGRGRLGRHWTSEPGVGIYVTLLTEVSQWQVERISLLPLMVGTAAAQSLRAPLVGTRQADEIRLKWPNDLIVSGRKLGGILIESLEQEGRRFAIVGIGINHGQAEADLPEARATSLRMVHGQADLDLPSLGDTTVALCRAVVDHLADPAPTEQILDSYRSLSAHEAGEELSWSSHEGQVLGRFVDIDSEGAIVIETSSGRRRVSSGDVMQVEKADGRR